MPNAIISWLNYVDGASFSTPYQASNLPVTNLANTIVSKVWRALGSTNTYFDVDFGSAVPIQVLALAGALLGATDTIRHKLSAVAAGSFELYDSGTLTGLNPNYKYHFNVLSAQVSARYWRCEINAASLAAQGYFDIGRAWAGPYWQPLRNFSLNNTEDFDDASRITAGLKSGAEYVDIGPQYRVRDFALNFMRGTDIDNAKELARYAGVRQQVLFIPNPSSSKIQTEGLIGRLRKTSPMSNPAFNLNSKSYQIYESL